MSAIHAIISSVNASSAAAPQPDLVWWKFDEGSGTTVADSSTVGTNGGTISGATWVTGKSGSGYALEFDGVDDFLRSTSNLTFGVKKCTVCAWVYLPSFADDGKAIWEHSTNQDSNQNTFHCAPNGTAGNFSATYRGNGYRSETTTRPATSTWVHVATTYDVETTTAADVEIYFDAVLQTTTVAVNTNSSSANNIATLTTYFMSRAGTSRFLAGRLDDVRIYKSVLTQAQIAAVMAEAA